MEPAVKDSGRFRPGDYAFFVFSAILVFLILSYGREVKGYFTDAIFQIILCVVVYYAIVYSSLTSSKVLLFLRDWYQVLLFVFNYRSVQPYIHSIQNGWLDHIIIKIEGVIYSVEPSLWFDGIASPLLTEYMKFSYFCYYLILPVLGFSLYLKGDRKAFYRLIFTVSTVFYISYISFILFPVQGPRYAFEGQYAHALGGYVFTHLQDLIMSVGSLHGGCMPSSHVAVALTVLLFAFKYRPRLFYFILVIVVSLFVSTVYNRYHYSLDVYAGILLGLACYLFLEGYYNKKLF